MASTSAAGCVPEISGAEAQLHRLAAFVAEGVVDYLTGHHSNPYASDCANESILWQAGYDETSRLLQRVPALLDRAVAAPQALRIAGSSPRGKAQRAAPVGRSAFAGCTAYGGAALAGEAVAVRNAAEGTRNDRLNRAAFRAGQLIAAGELDEATASAELALAGHDAGLRGVEIHSTIRSGVTAGKQHPRGAPRAA